MLFFKASGFAVLTLTSLLLWTSAPTATMIYFWHDASGVTFTDDPTNAPNDAHVTVVAEQAPAPSAPMPAPFPTESRVVTEQLPQVATQGAFAIQLVEELDLGDEPSEEEAADLLTQLHISPRLGQWALDRPMTADLAQRLRQLTVAAATRGRMTLTPEQSLLAFDTAAALLGVTLAEGEESHEGTASPYLLATAPPLVDVASPPPDLYPYYLWVPVAGGVWCNNVLVSGFFVLDGPRYFPHRHVVTMTPVHIGRHFQSHLTAGAPRGFVRTPRPFYSHSSGGRSGGIQPGHSIGASQPRGASPAFRRPAMRPHPMTSMGQARPLHSSYAIHAADTPTLMPRASDSSASHALSSWRQRGITGHGLQVGSFRK